MRDKFPGNHLSGKCFPTFHFIENGMGACNGSYPASEVTLAEFFLIEGLNCEVRQLLSASSSKGYTFGLKQTVIMGIAQCAIQMNVTRINLPAPCLSCMPAGRRKTGREGAGDGILSGCLLLPGTR